MYRYTLISCKHTLTHSFIVRSSAAQDVMELSVGRKALPAVVTTQQVWSFATKMLPICLKLRSGGTGRRRPPNPCDKSFFQVVPIQDFRGTGLAEVTFSAVAKVLGSFMVEMRDQIANIRWITEKTREFQKNIYFCFIDSAKAFDCVDHNKLENS